MIANKDIPNVTYGGKLNAFPNKVYSSFTDNVKQNVKKTKIKEFTTKIITNTIQIKLLKCHESNNRNKIMTNVEKENLCVKL